MKMTPRTPKVAGTIAGGLGAVRGASDGGAGDLGRKEWYRRNGVSARRERFGSNRFYSALFGFIRLFMGRGGGKAPSSQAPSSSPESVRGQRTTKFQVPRGAKPAYARLSPLMPAWQVTGRRRSATLPKNWASVRICPRWSAFVRIREEKIFRRSCGWKTNFAAKGRENEVSVRLRSPFCGGPGKHRNSGGSFAYVRLCSLTLAWLWGRQGGTAGLPVRELRLSAESRYEKNGLRPPLPAFARFCPPSPAFLWGRAKGEPARRGVGVSAKRRNGVPKMAVCPDLPRSARNCPLASKIFFRRGEIRRGGRAISTPKP
jgi:hypothetical protein